MDKHVKNGQKRKITDENIQNRTKMYKHRRKHKKKRMKHIKTDENG